MVIYLTVKLFQVIEHII